MVKSTTEALERRSNGGFGRFRWAVWRGLVRAWSRASGQGGVAAVTGYGEGMAAPSR